MTSTELGYLSGVTSNIQTQLDGKALSSHSHEDYLTINLQIHQSTTAFIVYGNGLDNNINTRLPISVSIGTQQGFGLNINLEVRAYNGAPVGYYYLSSARCHYFKWASIVYIINDEDNSTTYLIRSLTGGWGNGYLTYNPGTAPGFSVANAGYSITSLDSYETLNEAEQIYFPYKGDSLPDGAITGALFLLKA